MSEDTPMTDKAMAAAMSAAMAAVKAIHPDAYEIPACDESRYVAQIWDDTARYLGKDWPDAASRLRSPELPKGTNDR